MNEQEKELQYKTSEILGKDTAHLTLNEIIAELVNVVETQCKNSEE
ncbi:hypothetical protein V7128_16530 [Neobacillus vireti]